MRLLATLLTAAALAVLLHAAAVANPGGGQGKGQMPSPEQATQYLTGKLDALRANPSQKDAYIRCFREKAIHFAGDEQIDERMSQVNTIVDWAIGTSDAEYAANREQAGRRLWYWMTGV